MNGIWALVPIKCFTRAKSRLDAILTMEERESLARAFCTHVLSELRSCARSGDLSGVMVVTDCADVEAAARDAGAEVMRDGAEGGLAPIVDDALAKLAMRGARGAIVLMSDLPCLDAREVRDLARALAESPVVLAPDRHDEGTNALGLSPPNRFPTCFGRRDSFVRHRTRAAEAGIDAAIRRSGGLALDVDSPEDLALAESQAASSQEAGARFKWNRKRSSRVSAA